MVKVVHNIPTVLLYLPPQLSISSEVCSHPQKRVFARSFAPTVFPLQLNQSRSAVVALVEVLSGRKRRLLAQGELAALDGGYRQAVEFRHSFPQVFLRGNTSLFYVMLHYLHAVIKSLPFSVTFNITLNVYLLQIYYILMSDHFNLVNLK